MYTALWVALNAMTVIHATFGITYVRNGCDTAIIPNYLAIKHVMVVIHIL
jgi:hypothetical protein